MQCRAFHRKRIRVVDVMRVERGADRIDSCCDMVWRRRERRCEFVAGALDLAVLAQRNAQQIMRGRERGLPFQDAPVTRLCCRAIGSPMRIDGASPLRVHSRGIGHVGITLLD